LGLSFAQILAGFGISVFAFCDNNSKLWGTTQNGIDIISPDALAAMKDCTAVFISSTYYDSIKKQLEALGIIAVN
jgi:hypothetical protein